MTSDKNLSKCKKICPSVKDKHLSFTLGQIFLHLDKFFYTWSYLSLSNYCKGQKFMVFSPETLSQQKTILYKLSIFKLYNKKRFNLIKIGVLSPYLDSSKRTVPKTVHPVKETPPKRLNRLNASFIGSDTELFSLVSFCLAGSTKVLFIVLVPEPMI